MYKPNPADTSDIKLPDELMELTEAIAANVHDVWAVRKIEEGWVYGKKKDINLKTTPQLVEYNKLPESEKEYDRNTAMETIKLIVKLGFNITKSI